MQTRSTMVWMNSSTIGRDSVPVSLPINAAGLTEADPNSARAHDIMPDGRFIGVFGAPGENVVFGVAQINIVLNWFEELKERVPVP